MFLCPLPRADTMFTRSQQSAREQAFYEEHGSDTTVSFYRLITWIAKIGAGKTDTRICAPPPHHEPAPDMR